MIHIELTSMLEILSEYDQEIPQSQTADKPMAPKVRPCSAISRESV